MDQDCRICNGVTGLDSQKQLITRVAPWHPKAVAHWFSASSHPQEAGVQLRGITGLTVKSESAMAAMGDMARYVKSRVLSWTKWLRMYGKFHKIGCEVLYMSVWLAEQVENIISENNCMIVSDSMIVVYKIRRNYAKLQSQRHVDLTPPRTNAAVASGGSHCASAASRCPQPSPWLSRPESTKLRGILLNYWDVIGVI